MIRIFLGNVGSGKTISIIKEFVDREDNPHELPTFSNIITKSRGKYKLSKNYTINRDMLVLKELVKVKKSGEEIHKLTFNKDFWIAQREKHNGFNVVLDEAHTLMDARRFMSTQSKVLNDFLALIRKICNDPNSMATLTLISQLDSRIDINAREMATEIRYHICLWEKVCSKCGTYWSEHSNLPNYKRRSKCPSCGCYKLKKINNRIIVHFFDSMKNYQLWYYDGRNTILQTIRINNIEKYYNYYDTFQIDNLISE